MLPSQGRFLSEDPLDDDANAYRYVRNNPVNAVDPSGLEPIRIPTASGDVVIPDSAQTGYIGRLATLLRDADSSGNTSFATTVRRTLLVTWNEHRGLHSEHQLFEEQAQRLREYREASDPVYGPPKAAAKMIADTRQGMKTWSTAQEYENPRTGYLRFRGYLEYNAAKHGDAVARDLSTRSFDPQYATPLDDLDYEFKEQAALLLLEGAAVLKGTSLADDAIRSRGVGVTQPQPTRFIQPLPPRATAPKTTAPSPGSLKNQMGHPEIAASRARMDPVYGKPMDGKTLIDDAATVSKHVAAPTSVRPTIKTSLPRRVTQELPAGKMRTRNEVKQARNFFERNRDAARKWWEQRTGQTWPKDAVHDSHPRALKDGGDPLFIEPSYDNPWAPHIGPGDFSRWGKEGGFWKHKKNQ